MQHKPGKFEFANHGTMFLDEIGEMSFPLQAKLLQVLQDGEFSRLGGKHDVRVDVRLIAATNRNLEQAVVDGLLPRGPLLPSERRGDQLFRRCASVARTSRCSPIYFLKKYSVQYNKPCSGTAARTSTSCSRSTTGRATSANSKT